MACDSRCVMSRSPPKRCQCRCGGVNHGTGIRSAAPAEVSSEDLIGALHEGVQPLAEDLEKVEQRKRSVKTALAKEMEVRDVRLLGSHTRDTAIQGSDADYFAILPRQEARDGEDLGDSEELLNRVRDALQDCYPNSEISKDGQAIRLGFTDNPVDVVPAIYLGPVDESTGYPVYQIPDGTGGWIETGPGADSKYLREADERSGGRLKGVVRLLKAWKQTREATEAIKSLYIEMALAESGVAEGPPTSRAELFLEGLSALEERRLEDIPSPHGVGDPIVATHGFFAGSAARSAIGHALGHTQRAVEAEQMGAEEDAEEQWAEVFNHRLVSP